MRGTTVVIGVVVFATQYKGNLRSRPPPPSQQMAFCSIFASPEKKVRVSLMRRDV